MMMAFVLAVLALLTVSAPAPGQGDIRAAGARLQQARGADQAGDTAGYYAHARAASELVPGHPVLIYHHARAAAKAGRTEESLALLERLAPLGSPRDPASDSAFMTLWPLPAFRSQLPLLTSAVAPLVRSDTGFVIDLPNLVVENVAYDPVERVFFAGSMARRTVLRVDRSGRATPLTETGLDIGQPLGMKIDSKARLLWVASIWPVDSSAGRVRTRSDLLAISLPSGRIVRRLAPADTTGPHLLNDIIRAAGGTLYISDSEGRAVWVLEPKVDSLRELVRLPEWVLYPNGIALTPDERHLLVAHQSGIVAVDLRTRAVTPVAFPEVPIFMGIDGLYTAGARVIGVVNSSTVPQIVSGQVDGRSAAVRITCGQVLERRHPVYEIPTTGAVVGDSLFYVANSQLRRLDGRGMLRNPETEVRTVILRLRLPSAQNPTSCSGATRE